MNADEVASRLEQTAGRTRARTSEPPRGRRRREIARSRRKGPIAAGALIAALAVGWLVVGHSSSHASAPPAPADPNLQHVDVAPLEAMLGEPESCTDTSVTVPEMRCTVDGVRVDARLVDPNEVESTYLRATAVVVTPRAGTPACEKGRPDERAWSRPENPKLAVGRYLCRIEEGHAAMWWSEEHGLVAHAVADDRDLAKLFGWWRAHLDR